MSLPLGDVNVLQDKDTGAHANIYVTGIGSPVPEDTVLRPTGSILRSGVHFWRMQKL